MQLESPHRSRGRRRWRLILAICLVQTPTTIAAQVAPFQLPRLSSPVQLDGRPDEAAWSTIAPLPLVALYPFFDAPLTERTEIRIAYDSAALYGSIRAWDSEPRLILANTLYRDRWNGDDEFAVILDTFNDRENAVMFLVTPAGVRVDNQISNDAEPGRGNFLNQDWNAVWTARAAQTDSGWTAEFRVPFYSLRYRRSGRETRMRLKAFRYLPRKGENQMYPATRPDAGPAPHFQPSSAQEIVLFDLPDPRPLFVTPYVRGGSTSGTGISPDRDAQFGLDLKYSPLSSVALDATINTDFAQVEADDEQVNLTRFSLFFPEKRPFFQERAGLFSVSTGGASNVFYTRRVGLGDTGVPLPIRGGGRVTGTQGPWEFGGLGIWTAPSQSNGGADQVMVGRIRRRIGGQGMAGLIFTDRTTADGRSSTMAIDATSRLTPSTRASIAFARATPAIEGGSAADPLRLFAQVQRRVAGGLSWTMEYVGAGQSYDPSLGFVQQAGFHQAAASLGYAWRPGANAPVREHLLTWSGVARHRTTDHRPDDLSAQLFWGFETNNNVSGSIRFGAAHEHVPSAFSLRPGIDVSEGPYTTGHVRLTITSPWHRRFRVFNEVQAGSLFDGRRLTFSMEPTWAQSRHLELGGVLNVTRLDFPGSRRSTDRLVRGRVRIAATSQLFLETFLQSNSFTDVTASNVRFRYNPSEGHDLWLAWDQLERPGETPGARARASGLILKYSRLITLDLR
jgi:hypothetical protein